MASILYSLSGEIWGMGYRKPIHLIDASGQSIPMAKALPVATVGAKKMALLRGINYWGYQYKTDSVAYLNLENHVAWHGVIGTLQDRKEARQARNLSILDLSSSSHSDGLPLSFMRFSETRLERMHKSKLLISLLDSWVVPGLISNHGGSLSEPIQKEAGEEDKELEAWQYIDQVATDLAGKIAADVKECGLTPNSTALFFSGLGAGLIGPLVASKARIGKAFGFRLGPLFTLAGPDLGAIERLRPVSLGHNGQEDNRWWSVNLEGRKTRIPRTGQQSIKRKKTIIGPAIVSDCLDQFLAPANMRMMIDAYGNYVIEAY
jgi:hypothetical protein